MTHPTISQKAVEAALDSYDNPLAPYGWRNASGALQAQLRFDMERAIRAALAVDGLVLVPKEPTEEMLDAGACYKFQDRHIVDDGDISRDVYRAMLAAAPIGTENNNG